MIKNNKMWIGASSDGRDMVFGVPEGAEIKNSDKEKAAKLGYKGNYTRMGNCCWYTNIEHGKRHTPIPLMTYEENLKFSKHKELNDRMVTIDELEKLLNMNFFSMMPDKIENQIEAELPNFFN